MECNIIHQRDCSASHWSGGSTTELFVWPPESSYAERNFSLRISTATVDVDRSDFTPLPGVTRLLTVLQGEMRLQIEGRGDIPLPPWQTIRFDGGDKTTSFGRCVDFGLMLRGGWDGSLRAEAAGEYHCDPNGFTGVYSPVGAATVAVEAQGREAPFLAALEPGDLLLLRNGARLTVRAEEPVLLLTAYPTAPLPNLGRGSPGFGMEPR